MPGAESDTPHARPDNRAGQPGERDPRRLVEIAAPGVLITCAALAVVLCWAPAALLVLLHDGIIVALVLAATAGLGAWPAQWLRGRGRADLAWFCSALATGAGILATITLMLGVAGLLGRVTAAGLLAAGVVLLLLATQWPRTSAAAGTPHSAGARLATRPPAAGPPVGQGAGGGRAWWAWPSLLLAPLIVPLAVTLFGATLPPGVLWSEEAGAYDVLEYHLQAPREYFDAGHIQFLPHNVYASFPQLVEMHYLLLMHLTGGPLEAATAAQLWHAAYGVLAVLALGAWSSPGPARWAAMLLAGSAPWLAYLGCLAYVELPMLFFAAVAAGSAMESAGWSPWSPDRAGDVPPPGSARPSRLALAAGLAAGLAGGCKYTALALVAAGLGVSVFALSPLRWGERLRWLGLFALGAVITFSPWLIRNVAFTGNPVHPFAYSWFGGAAWNAEQAEQWTRGHQPPAGFQSASGRVRLAARELLYAAKYGLPLWIIALAGLLRSRSRAAGALAIWAGLVVLVWALTTQMAGRLALPVIVPTVLLGGLAAGVDPLQTIGTRGQPRRRLAVLAVLAACFCGAIANGVHLLRLLRESDRWWQRHRVELAELPGAVPDMAAAQPLNQLLGPGGSLRSSGPPPRPVQAWLVGEARAFYLQFPAHYTVVFSRDPWVEFAQSAGPADAVDWLRTHGVTHLVFSWAEIRRLRETYGFPAWVTPAWADGLASGGLRRVPLEHPAVGGVRAAEERGVHVDAAVDVYEVLVRDKPAD